MANKASRTIQEQIELLENRGMLFRDKAFATECLKRISYFRLKAYWWDMQCDPVNHVFTNGSCFEDVIERYEFDNALRKILFTAIDTIEIALLTTKIYDQSKEIEKLELAGWKYRALRATLPANNANVIWLERNVWAGNKEGIRHCQQFVIRSTSGRLACPRTTRTPSVAAIRWKWRHNNVNRKGSG